MNYNDAATSSSSLCEFFYIQTKNRGGGEVLEPTIPTFIAATACGRGFLCPRNVVIVKIPPTPQHRLRYFEQVKTEFAQYEYIDRIEVHSKHLPLSGGQGFLRRLTKLHGYTMLT